MSSTFSWMLRFWLFLFKIFKSVFGDGTGRTSQTKFRVILTPNHLQNRATTSSVCLIIHLWHKESKSGRWSMRIRDYVTFSNNRHGVRRCNWLRNAGPRVAGRRDDSVAGGVTGWQGTRSSKASGASWRQEHGRSSPDDRVMRSWCAREEYWAPAARWTRSV